MSDHIRLLYVPIIGFPEILYRQIDSIKYSIFENNPTQILSLDSHINFYAYTNEKYLSSPINKMATFFKRLYSNNYSMNNVIRGPILIAGSSTGDPDIIDSSFPPHFLEELFHYYHINIYEYRQD